jgi:aerobic carbon-monoxide dehydrogenase medium subunit
MIPAKFDYVRVDSADAAVAALVEHGDDAKILAGGHSLVPLLKLRLASPSVLVDVGRVKDLSYIRDAGDHIAIGALTRHREVETSALLAQHVPLLPKVAHHVGDNQVRHRGTIGGSIAHGDPASDLPTAALALGATLVARGPKGERTIAAADFFHGFLTTALAADELLTEIRVPKTTGAGADYQKFNRRAQDWAIVGVAAWKQNGSVGVALTNMGSVPVRATAVENAVKAGASAADAAALAADGLEPPADLNASVEYRKHLARVLTKRALNAAGLA